MRETLAGGWYGLTNLTSMEVYPDFYSALLFTRYATSRHVGFGWEKGSN